MFFFFQGANASQLEKEIGSDQFPVNEHYFGLVNVSIWLFCLCVYMCVNLTKAGSFNSLSFFVIFSMGYFLHFVLFHEPSNNLYRILPKVYYLSSILILNFLYYIIVNLFIVSYHYVHIYKKKFTKCFNK